MIGVSKTFAVAATDMAQSTSELAGAICIPAPRFSRRTIPPAVAKPEFFVMRRKYFDGTVGGVVQSVISVVLKIVVKPSSEMGFHDWRATPAAAGFPNPTT
jgi:hypothetical protein